MVVMVFANVVLRYGFGSGITMSEEISRFLFVWLIFLGSVPVMRQHGHLGVEMLVGKLSPAGRRLCRGISDMLVLRSEARRVGKECRSRWWPSHYKKKQT